MFYVQRGSNPIVFWLAAERCRGVRSVSYPGIELGNAYVTCEIICCTGKRVADSDHFLARPASRIFYYFAV